MISRSAAPALFASLLVVGVIGGGAVLAEPQAPPPPAAVPIIRDPVRTALIQRMSGVANAAGFDTRRPQGATPPALPKEQGARFGFKLTDDIDWLATAVCSDCTGLIVTVTDHYLVAEPSKVGAVVGESSNPADHPEVRFHSRNSEYYAVMLKFTGCTAPDGKCVAVIGVYAKKGPMFVQNADTSRAG
ncbi:hypothetical protein BH11PSE2_BH11PSE2_12820 [soil metagenome]